jgi:hypothetical protein
MGSLSESCNVEIVQIAQILCDLSSLGKERKKGTSYRLVTRFVYTPFPYNQRHSWLCSFLNMVE